MCFFNVWLQLSIRPSPLTTLQARQQLTAFLQDNARPQTARVSVNILTVNSFAYWPSSIWKMAPIDHVRDWHWETHIYSWSTSKSERFGSQIDLGVEPIPQDLLPGICWLSMMSLYCHNWGSRKLLVQRLFCNIIFLKGSCSQNECFFCGSVCFKFWFNKRYWYVFFCYVSFWEILLKISLHFSHKFLRNIVKIGWKKTHTIFIIFYSI